MGIILFRKEKFDKRFIKQTIDKVVLRKNIDVYETLKDKGITVGDKQLDVLRNNLAKATDNALKNGRTVVNQYSKAVGIYEAIKRFQTGRRHKVLDVVRKYMEIVEGKEVQRFVERFGANINIPLFDKIVKDDFSMYDEVFGLDLFSLENLIEEEKPSEDVDVPTEEKKAEPQAEEPPKEEKPTEEKKDQEKGAEPIKSDNVEDDAQENVVESEDPDDEIE